LKMNCEKMSAFISDYYDGELDASLVEEFETHMANCKVCASELSNFKAISGMLKSTHAPKIAARAVAPSWEQFATRREVPHQIQVSNSAFNPRRMFAYAIGVVALAASILLIVSLTSRTNPSLVAHNHKHALTNNADIAIGFEKLLDGEASQPIAALNSLSKTFDGREAAIESETELGYEPSISQALPSGVKLVSNRILKLPPCNCTADECSCGSARCICAASLCKRVDGSEFLVIEHCETQNVSFGHLKSELLRDENYEVQLMNTGKQLVASWITDHHRLTAIGLNDKTEALAIIARVASR